MGLSSRLRWSDLSQANFHYANLSQANSGRASVS
ncbi:MAG: pentapeptide repeat-containing protein [Zwartia sp.]